MKKPIVSVLIPVYNVEKYLKKCLDSVIGQTLQDIEIICVNDGSTDDSAKILQEYAEQDNRIIIVTKKNGGLPSARNAGLERASGKYLGFVDSDDYIECNMFERMVQVAEENSSDIVICGANIFPETPRASQWLYDTLSPTFKHYTKFEPEILFDRIDTTPFLWRTLVRKQLIDAGKFRLDEDIIIGEDKAFQCKIYPQAKSITVIPDKLYNYFWCRPDSLMSKQVYGKYADRVNAHTKLVGRICDSLLSSTKEKNEMESTLKSFVEWSLPFIYNDFIYLSEKQKCNLASKLITSWKKANYYRVKYLLPEWKREQFEYIEMFTKNEADIPRLSIVIPVEYTTRYLDNWLKKIDTINDKDIEIIIINNGTNDDNYIKIQNLMYKNKHVRLYNTPAHLNYANSLNMGIDLSSGEYIVFAEVQDWFKSKKDLLDWLEYSIKTKADICIDSYGMRKVDSDGVVQKSLNVSKDVEGFDSNYHQVLYNKKYLLNNKIDFKSASILTGYLFLCKTILNSCHVEKFDRSVYIIREMHHPDWLSTEKCEIILEALNELIELSLKKKNAYLHAKVFSILNGDKMKRIILNNTRPYCMPTAQCPNGENSQIKSVETIFKIVHNADQELLYQVGYTDSDSILDILYEVIKIRHQFLAEMN